jgi:amino acid transporter
VTQEQETPEVPGLERRVTQRGRRPGDRYVRIVGSRKDFRRAEGHYVATEAAIQPPGGFGRVLMGLRRRFFGQPLGSEAEAQERLSVSTAYAVIASDNISSSAYATEEAMRVLALAGVAALALTLPIALAVVGVLAVVVISELQVIRAYPSGGGSYIVASDNHGRIAGLVAASALLIDYVLTVAVSTAAGVAAIGSFVPGLQEMRVPVGLFFIGLLVVGNLRGIREAGMIFAIPTYLYVISIVGLIGYGLFRVIGGDIPPAAIPPDPFPPDGVTALSLLLVLRAFSSGSVGLTGAEATANGVPSMKPPETRNASITLVLMATTFATIFLGLTYLAQRIGVAPSLHEQETLNSLVTRSLVGEGPAYYAVQVSTAVILALAANTGFTGFPRLAAVLANDRFMPRHFADRGERLAFSFGIIVLAAVAGGVLVAFGGSVGALIPLYTIGVFVAFTLSQSGLVRRWARLRPPRWRLTAAVNLTGAIVTGTVLVITIVTKFEHGAWIVLVVMPVIVLILHGINVHYRTTHDSLVLPDLRRGLPSLPEPMVVVPVARLDRTAERALTFASSISKHVRAVHIATSHESAQVFDQRWNTWAAKVPLDIIVSPYRALVPPLLKYIERVGSTRERPLTVVVSQFVPRHWWEFFLHSQTAFRLKLALLFRPDTIVIDVPYHPRASSNLGITPTNGTDREG